VTFGVLRLRRVLRATAQPLTERAHLSVPKSRPPYATWLYSWRSPPPSFHDRVHARCLRCCADDPDAFGAEYLVEHAGELTVAVPDQKREAVHASTQLEHQVAGLLSDPGPGGVCGDAQEVIPARRMLDGGEAVQPDESDRLDREEVVRQDPFGL
jgi:hypothetical protein